MSSTSTSVLVTLATGKQGSKVVKALSLHNDNGKNTFRILAVTRDATSSKSKNLLTYPGVQLIEGDINGDQTANELFETVKSKVSHLDAVFFAQLGPDNPEGLYDGEIKQAKRFVDLVVKHKVSHLIYSGVAALQEEDDTGVPYFESKRVIEKHIKDTLKSSGATIWTILQPSSFMENLTRSNDESQIVMNTVLAGVLTSPLQWISCLDIGKFAARAILEPEKYKGKSIALASDNSTGQELMSKWPKAGLGDLKTFPVEPLRQQLEQVDFMAKLFKFINTVGYKVDIAALRRDYPDMLDLETFLSTELE